MSKRKASRTKQQVKEHKVKKREERKATALVEKGRRLAAAGVQWDPRTAQGKRHFDIATTGPKLRASVNHFNACFKRKGDRTASRTVAWAYFDEHCHRVHAGDLPNPRFEAGVDVSKRPGVADSRLDALALDRVLQGVLGRDMHGLLLEVIYYQKTYLDLVGRGYGDERLIAGMFKRALDLAAAYWGVGEDNSFGREANRVLAQAAS